MEREPDLLRNIVDIVINGETTSMRLVMEQSRQSRRYDEGVVETKSDSSEDWRGRIKQESTHQFAHVR